MSIVIEPGIYTDLDIDEYHKDPAIGSSGIKEFIESPYNYWYKYLNPCSDRTNDKKTDYQRIGQQAHLKLLEPHKFFEEYQIAPQEIKKKTTKPWKDFEKHCKELGKKPLINKEYHQVAEMMRMIQEEPDIHGLLTNGKPEVSFFGYLEELDILIKGRPDYIKRTSEGLQIVDYKTTSASLSSDTQNRNAFSNNQHMQAAVHSMAVTIASGCEVTEVVYIVQSTNPPYLLRHFTFEKEDVELGMQKAMHFLEQISCCVKNNTWPKPSVEREYYVRPKWVDYENYPNFINSNHEVIYE